MNFHTQTYCSGSLTDVSTPFPVTIIKNVSCNSAQPNAIGTYYDVYGDMKCNFEPPTPNNPANFVPPNQCIFGTQCFKQAQPNSWIMNTCVFYPKSGGLFYFEQLFNVQNDYVLPWFCRIDYASQTQSALSSLTYCYHTKFGSATNVCYGNCGGCSPSKDAACFGFCPNFNVSIYFCISFVFCVNVYI